MTDLFKKLQGAFADNTLRAYRCDFRIFEDWCQLSATDPLDATPDDLAEFVEWMSETKSSATITRRIASLSSLFDLNGCRIPQKAPK